MNLVIIGAGKVGETLIESLVKENHDITVVDVDATTVQNVINHHDVQGVVGGGAHCDIGHITLDLTAADHHVGLHSVAHTGVVVDQLCGGTERVIKHTIVIIEVTNDLRIFLYVPADEHKSGST